MLVLISLLILPISLLWGGIYVGLGAPSGLLAFGYFAHGTPGRIQITAATRELLGDEFTCERRGTIAVKGKGEMEAWYVVGRRTAERSAEPAAAAADQR